jgi:hypothetical protein
VSLDATPASTSGRESEDNKTLLQIQNPALAAEGLWAHPTPRPEQGGILVASNSITEKLDNEKYEQVNSQALTLDPAPPC